MIEGGISRGGTPGRLLLQQLLLLLLLLWGPCGRVLGSADSDPVTHPVSDTHALGPS